MSDRARNLSINLAGALVVGLSVGCVFSGRIGGPPFRELFPFTFLYSFAPYALAALLAPKFAARFSNPRAASCVFIPVVGSAVSFAALFPSLAGLSYAPTEELVELATRGGPVAAATAAAAAVIFAAMVVPYALFGFVVLAAVNGVAVIFGRPSYR